MLRKSAPALGILLLALLAGLLRHSLDGFDASIFDGEVSSPAHPSAPWPPDLLLVAIDDASVNRYSRDGQWPIHREDLVRVFDRLRALGARTIFFDGKLVTHSTPAIDADFVRVLPAVILPVAFTDAAIPGTDSILMREALRPEDATGAPRVRLENLQAPIEPFASAAHGLAHVVATFDRDGRQRRFYPAVVVGTSGSIIPSAPLAALALQRGLDLREMRYTSDALEIPGLPRVPLQQGSLLLELNPALDARKPRVSMLDLLEPKDSEAMAKRVAGRMVLIYLEGKEDASPSPLGPETHGGQILAHALRALASGHAPRRLPAGGILLVLGGLLAAAAGPLTRRSPRSIAGLTLGAGVLYAVFQVQVFQRADLFAPMLLPLGFLFVAGSFLAILSSWRADERADWHRAPTGRVALVFTDVQGSTALWEAEPVAMQRALALHNACLRALLADIGGYEVKTEGDAFMIAFADALTAATWCLTAQQALLALDWPAEILAHADASEVRGAGGEVLFRGLRVRMGIHTGEPEPHVEPLTGRMDYFGPVVNKAARVSGVARGGQIVVSDDAWSELAPKRGLLPRQEVRDLGNHALKGLATEAHLIEIIPTPLAAREFRR